MYIIKIFISNYKHSQTNDYTFFGPQFTCDKKRNISFGQSMKKNDILLNFGTKSQNNNI